MDLKKNAAAIEAGRTAREFSRLELPNLPDGFYFFEYAIFEHR